MGRVCESSLRFRSCYFFKTFFHIIIPNILRSSKRYFSLRFPHRNPVRIAPLHRTCYMPRPSSWFDKANNNWWTQNGTELDKKRWVWWLNIVLKYNDNDDDFNSVNDQLDAQFLYVIIRLLQSSTCFEQRRAHHQDVKLY